MTLTLKECIDSLRTEISCELSRVNKGLKMTVSQLASKSKMDPAMIKDVLDCNPGLSVSGLAKIAHAMDCRVEIKFIPFKEVK